MRRADLALGIFRSPDPDLCVPGRRILRPREPCPVTSFYFQGLGKCFLEISIRLEVLLAALFISVSNRYQKKTI